MAIKPAVPENGCSGYQISGCRQRIETSVNGPSGRCIQQQKKLQQHQRARLENQVQEELVAEAPNSGIPDAIVHSDYDSIVGNELVWQYFTVMYNAPEHLWRFYAESAQYCHVNANGLRAVVTGLPHLRGLLESTTAKCHGLVIVDSVNTVRFAPNHLLVMATSEQFVQSFVVDIKSPRSFTVVASIIHHPIARLLAPYAPSASYPPAAPPVSYPPPADNRGTKTDHVVGGCQSSDNRQLFVGQLLSTTTSEHLREKFAEFGEVKNVRIMSGYNRFGRPTMFNYGFVAFSNPEAVDAVLSNQPIKLSNGNKVNVKRAKDRHN